MELHRVDVEVRFAGVVRQAFSVPFSELDSVQLTDKHLTIRTGGAQHVIATRGLETEGLTTLRDLLMEVLRERGETERRAPKELLAMVQRQRV